jgi:hypothetical protein
MPCELFAGVCKLGAIVLGRRTQREINHTHSTILDPIEQSSVADRAKAKGSLKVINDRLRRAETAGDGESRGAEGGAGDPLTGTAAKVGP